MRGNPIYLSLVWLTDLNGKVFQVCLLALFFSFMHCLSFPPVVFGGWNTECIPFIMPIENVCLYLYVS